MCLASAKRGPQRDISVPIGLGHAMIEENAEHPIADAAQAVTDRPSIACTFASRPGQISCDFAASPGRPRAFIALPTFTVASTGTGCAPIATSPRPAATLATTYAREGPGGGRRGRGG